MRQLIVSARFFSTEWGFVLHHAAFDFGSLYVLSGFFGGAPSQVGTMTSITARSKSDHFRRRLRN
jgi:hypothetical protein